MSISLKKRSENPARRSLLQTPASDEDVLKITNFDPVLEDVEFQRVAIRSFGERALGS
jgi:hypothetical protein